MATSKTYKRNDTSPPAVITLTDGPDDSSQVAVNLTGATTIKFLMGTIDAAGVKTTKITRSMTVVSASTGVVRHNWQSGDLDTAGTFKAEVEVTWPDGTIQTFPNDSYLDIVVMPDVG